MRYSTGCPTSQDLSKIDGQIYPQLDAAKIKARVTQDILDAFDGGLISAAIAERLLLTIEKDTPNLPQGA